MVRRPAVADHRWMILNAASGRRGWGRRSRSRRWRTTRLPNIVYQQLLWPALSAELDTESYRSYGEGRFLPRAFMQYGWDHYAPIRRRARTGTQPRYRPPRNSCAACRPPSSRSPSTTCCATRERPPRASSTRPGADVANVRYNGTIHDFALLNALLDVPQHWRGHGAPPRTSLTSSAYVMARLALDQPPDYRGNDRTDPNRASRGDNDSVTRAVGQTSLVLT